MIWVEITGENVIAAMRISENPDNGFFVIDFETRQLVNYGPYPNLISPHFSHQPDHGVHYFLRLDLHQWLMERKICYQLSGNVESAEKFKILVGFSNVSDATLFKLTWG